MLKTLLSLLVAVMLLLVTVPTLPLPDKVPARVVPRFPTVEAVKSRVARLGVGAKAKATIRLKNGTKVKGYIAQAERKTLWFGTGRLMLPPRSGTQMF